jgi:predicted secreted protein
MTPLMTFFVFLNAWWVCLFAVLPLGIKRDAQAMPGDYEAAPDAVNWKQKFWQTTLLAGLITALLALVIASGIVRVK